MTGRQEGRDAHPTVQHEVDALRSSSSPITIGEHHAGQSAATFPSASSPSSLSCSAEPTPPCRSLLSHPASLPWHSACSSRKPKRHRTTNEQYNILSNAFDKEPLPTATARHALAKLTGMTPRGVQVWFQNRRAKLKNDATKHREFAQSFTDGSTQDAYFNMHRNEDFRFLGAVGEPLNTLLLPDDDVALCYCSSQTDTLSALHSAHNSSGRSCARPTEANLLPTARWPPNLNSLTSTALAPIPLSRSATVPSVNSNYRTAYIAPDSLDKTTNLERYSRRATQRSASSAFGSNSPSSRPSSPWLPTLPQVSAEKSMLPSPMTTPIPITSMLPTLNDAQVCEDGHKDFRQHAAFHQRRDTERSHNNLSQFSSSYSVELSPRNVNEYALSSPNSDLQGFGASDPKYYRKHCNEQQPNPYANNRGHAMQPLAMRQRSAFFAASTSCPSAFATKMASYGNGVGSFKRQHVGAFSGEGLSGGSDLIQRIDHATAQALSSSSLCAESPICLDETFSSCPSNPPLLDPEGIGSYRSLFHQPRESQTALNLAGGRSLSAYYSEAFQELSIKNSSPPSHCLKSTHDARESFEHNMGTVELDCDLFC